VGQEREIADERLIEHQVAGDLLDAAQPGDVGRHAVFEQVDRAVLHRLALVGRKIRLVSVSVAVAVAVTVAIPVSVSVAVPRLSVARLAVRLARIAPGQHDPTRTASRQGDDRSGRQASMHRIRLSQPVYW
jgi:hypothetical protein